MFGYGGLNIEDDGTDPADKLNFCWIYGVERSISGLW